MSLTSITWSLLHTSVSGALFKFSPQFFEVVLKSAGLLCSPSLSPAGPQPMGWFPSLVSALFRCYGSACTLSLTVDWLPGLTLDLPYRHDAVCDIGSQLGLCTTSRFVLLALSRYRGGWFLWLWDLSCLMLF